MALVQSSIESDNGKFLSEISSGVGVSYSFKVPALSAVNEDEIDSLIASAIRDASDQ